MDNIYEKTVKTNEFNKENVNPQYCDMIKKRFYNNSKKLFKFY